MGIAEEFGYAHHSGRYDQSPESLATATLNITKLPRVSIIAFTEVSSPERYKALDTTLTKVGWGLIYQPDHNKDTAIGFDKAEFNKQYAITKKLDNVPSPGIRRNSWSSLTALLEHRESQRTYIVSVAHTPSHTISKVRMNAHREGMKSWNQELRRLTLLWTPSGGRIVSMDLNMDVALKRVRLYLARMMPTMHLIKDSGFVNTHDVRTIDVILIGRRLNPVKWFRGRYVRVIPTRDSDHRTIIVHLRRVR